MSDGPLMDRPDRSPTVVLVIQQGFSARILLQTEVLDTLLESGARVVVLTSDPPTMQRYLDGRGLSSIAVEKLDINQYGTRRSGLFKHLLRHIRFYSVKTRTVDDLFRVEWKNAWSTRSLGLIGIMALTWPITRLTRVSPLAMKTVVALENRGDTPRVLESFFDKHRPNAVVLTSMGVFDYDHYVIREAKRWGTRVISCVLGLDNPTVRGLGVNLSDQYIVWSDVMKEELVKLHRVPAEAITVDGVPHYDHYVNGKSKIGSKEWLTQEFGFDPDKRLLLLGTKSPSEYQYNPDVARAICDAIRDGLLPADCHLIARLHPIYFRRIGGRYVFEDQWHEWELLLEEYGNECLSVDRPAMNEGQLNFFMPDSELPKLASLLKHSDVVINMFSTLNVEASIFDSPTVNVAFNFEHKPPPGAAIARFDIHIDEVQTHNHRIIESNGTSVAHSVDELIAQINRYLDNPRLHVAGRARMVTTECGVKLGRAGRAMGQTILNHIGRVA
jgi:hypothetical protein